MSNGESTLNKKNFFYEDGESADFDKWCEKQDELRKEVTELPNDDLYWLVTHLIWRKHKLDKKVEELEIECRHAWNLGRVNTGQAKIMEQRKLRREQPNIITGKKTRENLQRGSIKAAKERTNSAKEKETVLKKAVADLFASGEGWKMSNDEITYFIIKKGIGQMYTDKTLKRKLSTIIAKERKNR